jgi:hypothetical protein
MLKFKVGNRVEIIGTNIDDLKSFQGCKGRIIKIKDDEPVYLYLVHIDNSELMLYSKVKRIRGITEMTSGDKITLFLIIIICLAFILSSSVRSCNDRFDEMHERFYEGSIK